MILDSYKNYTMLVCNSMFVSCREAYNICLDFNFNCTIEMTAIKIELSVLSKDTAHKLAVIRKNAKINQEVAAKHCGISRLLLGMIENWQRDIELTILSRLLELYGIAFQDFFSDKIYKIMSERMFGKLSD